MKFRSIIKKDYPFLLELDKKVYPTDSPVNKNILGKWFKNNPEFGLVFEDDGKIKGMCIAIPLNKNGWVKLIDGELAESDLGNESIFDNSRDREIGVHIYHIEKFSKNKGFYLNSLEGLNYIISKLRANNPYLRVIGFSGLCATVEGAGLFYNKLNCRERKFVSSEYILNKNGKLKLYNLSSSYGLKKKIDEGYEVITRCKMLVVYPDEPSVVWSIIK